MPQKYCQDYPGPLDSLTFTEEAIITRAHLVITILKLRSNNRFNLGLYRGIQGHSIFLPQNSGPLLNLLSSDITSVNDVMQVVWAGKTAPQHEQLKRFVNIWKHHILSTLN